MYENGESCQRNSLESDPDGRGPLGGLLMPLVVAAVVRSGGVALADLAITKQLTKDPADYADKKALPHVQVAARMNSKAGGKKLKAGDTVEYVICDDASGLAATQRAYHVDEVRERAGCEDGEWVGVRLVAVGSAVNYRRADGLATVG